MVLHLYLNLEKPVRVASTTRINLEEPIRVDSTTRINLEETIRVASTTRINLEEPIRVASTTRIHSLRVGWRNLFSSCAVVLCQFLVLVGKRF